MRVDVRPDGNDKAKFSKIPVCVWTRPQVKHGLAFRLLLKVVTAGWWWVGGWELGPNWEKFGGNMIRMLNIMD